MGPTCREHRAAVDQPELFENVKAPRIAEPKVETIVDFDKLRGR